MLRKYFILVLFFVLCCNQLFADLINIGIFHDKKVTSFIFLPEEGSYSVFTEKGKLLDIDNSELLELKYRDNEIEVKSLDKDYGRFKKIRFIGNSQSNSFKIKVPFSKRIRIYEDNLFIDLHDYYNYFQLINNIDIDKYVAGVVESEVGRRPNVEYFKLQSIICRTYALKNIDRHINEGFSLCDRVHCQAYNQKPKSTQIRLAALATNNMVIVDNDINLISATFYSNCGGQTANSEEVWNDKLYYLRSTKDTFCLHETNATWSKKISKKNWLNYLSKYDYNLGSVDEECALEYFQCSREQFFLKNNVQIPLVEIRKDLKLKSTMFDVVQKNNSITINGKGFGHGVGLCQEGAMRMAKLGYTYIDILHFYYKDVHMINLESMDFFKSDF